jgi:hypothetical protein
MWMYYTAATTAHGGLAPEKEQSIARAAWWIDGLASLQAKDKLGSIETHDFVPEGDKLTVNADVKNGRLSVEALDATGQVIPGYDKESSVIFKQDSVKLSIRWKDADALPAGKTIRLRFHFHLENGDLYSYLID